MPPKGAIPPVQWAAIVEAERRRRFLADVHWSCDLLTEGHSPGVHTAAERALAAAVQDERYGPAALEIVREKGRLMEGKAYAAENIARVLYLVLGLLSTILFLYLHA